MAVTNNFIDVLALIENEVYVSKTFLVLTGVVERIFYAHITSFLQKETKEVQARN